MEKAMKSKWQDEIAVGRVFELRSQSKRYAPPLVLIIKDEDPPHWNDGIVADLDVTGRTAARYLGMYHRRGNPRISTAFMKRGDFNSKRIARRRPELERFDANDIAAIRYGLSVTVGGRLESGCYDMDYVPTIVPGMTWTIFWTRDHDTWDFPFRDELAELLNGAWHFKRSSLPNWKWLWARAWATAHNDCRRLRAIEHFLRHRYSDLERQSVTVARWHDWQALWTHTWTIGNPGPAIGASWSHLKTPTGSISYTR
jgi:hypothetical protein